MSKTFEDRLQRRLNSLREIDLFRELPDYKSGVGRTVEQEGETYVNFSSNDYLGLSTHGEVIEAQNEASKEYGAGSGGSRLISGNHELYGQLEGNIAEWKQTEAALVLGSGYLTNLGVIPAVTTGRDLIVCDELSHRCIVEATQLSEAESRQFTHNNVAKLRELLADCRATYDGCMIIVEGIYSMDGDRAPLKEILEVAGEMDCWVLVDEAHSSGVWGEGGAGLTPEYS
ncbi:MAG: aminotransferase class I/II-fold pyridoxal phosphate-dependent enzyme, partial [bacterium]